MHCFEPGPITFDRVVGNIRLNGFSSNIFPYRCAVSNQNGIGYLADHSKSVERALLRTQTAVVGAEQVETITLQTALELCGDPHVDLLKVDIEGSEMELVCSGPLKTWESIERVAIEFHRGFRPGYARCFRRHFAKEVLITSQSVRLMRRRDRASCKRAADIVPETMAPRVSVIIPVYNGEATIALAIDNALDQEFDSFEVIVVDDGSTDFTPEVLERFRGRIRAVNLRSNKGAATARNEAAAIASGGILPSSMLTTLGCQAN